jgi:hypothetical protein
MDFAGAGLSLDAAIGRAEGDAATVVRHALALAASGSFDAAERELMELYASLRAEADRLKRGDFTEAEFQSLCHGFSEGDMERFGKGCEEYQRRLFGVAAVDKARARIAELLETKWRHLGPDAIAREVRALRC